MNVYILLDRSGSMQNQWSEALSSINAYVKELPKDTNVHLAAFDHDYTVVRNTTVKKWNPINNDEIQPRGNTRLFDAAARIMQRAIDDNEERTMIVVMTDGEENASLNFKQADIKALTGVIDSKKWELVFLGANFDKVGDVAVNNFGRTSNKFYNMTSGNFGSSMTATLATASAAYATRGEAINFTDEDKARARGGK
jgi:uncharacterized protein YegL